mgnify:CR=1 FL=1
MLQSDLVERLLRLDEDADLLFDSANRFRIVIVGGSAFILLERLSRSTHDIDVLSVPQALFGLLAKYDINAKAEAYIFNFPYNFEDRLVQVPIKTQKIDFFTPCLEDLVIAKLCSHRDTDLADVENPTVRENLDWDLLDYLAHSENEAKASAMNDRCYQEFLIRYETYVRRWHSCEN